MKKPKLLLGVIAAVGILSIALSSSVGAQTFRSGTNTSVGSAEVIDGTLFVSGRTVEVAAEVNGDLYCGGLNITITGKVNGDVICAGQTVQITGEVDGDIRIAGQTVTLQGRVTGSATILAQSFILDSKGEIGRDVVLGSSDATLNGTIGRDIVLGGEAVVVSGTVGRNVTGSATTLSIEKSAKITGKIDYTSKNQIQKDDQATVGGTITWHQSDANDRSKRGAALGFNVGWLLYCLIAMLLLTLVLLGLFPRLFRIFSDRALANPFKPLLVGLTASIVVPIIVIILLITAVGVPLALFLGVAWLLILLASGPVSGFYIGRQVLPKSQNLFGVGLAGSSLLLLLYFVPFVGFIAMLLGLWLGSGVIVLELMTHLPYRDSQKLSAKAK